MLTKNSGKLFTTSLLVVASVFSTASLASQGQSTAELVDFSYSLQSLNGAVNNAPTLTISYGPDNYSSTVNQSLMVTHGPNYSESYYGSILAWSNRETGLSILGSEETSISANKNIGGQLIEDVGYASVGNGQITAGETLYAVADPYHRSLNTSVLHYETWTLSAQSSVTLSGTVVLKAQVDGHLIEDDIYSFKEVIKAGNHFSSFDMGSDGYLDLSAGSVFDIDFFALDAETGYLTPIEGAVVTNAVNTDVPWRLDVDQRVYASGGLPTEGVQGEVVIPFQVTLVNTGDTEATYKMQASLGAYSNTQVYAWNYGPQVPSIPEPSTYALMLLGLGGLAAAVRRQQRQATTH